MSIYVCMYVCIYTQPVGVGSGLGPSPASHTPRSLACERGWMAGVRACLTHGPAPRRTSRRSIAPRRAKWWAPCPARSRSRSSCRRRAAMRAIASSTASFEASRDGRRHGVIKTDEQRAALLAATHTTRASTAAAAVAGSTYHAFLIGIVVRRRGPHRRAHVQGDEDARPRLGIPTGTLTGTPAEPRSQPY